MSGVRTVEAESVPVKQAEVPPCEVWACAWFVNGRWNARVEAEESEADNCAKHWQLNGATCVHKFRLSDAPAPTPAQGEDEVVLRRLQCFGELTGRELAIARNAYRAGAASVKDREIADGEHYDGAPGLTKREYFACAAMQGLLAGLFAQPLKAEWSVVAEGAIYAADALLAKLAEATK